MKKEYEIWIEGFIATGQSQRASFIGKAKGNNFKEACKSFRYPENIIREYDGELIVKKGTKLKLDKHYKHPSIWACRLFDNEKDARKSFG